MDEYYIAFDASGSAYLEHAWFGNRRGSTKKDHKYIEKIGDRYFYTREELSAYYNKAKRSAASTINKAKESGVRAADSAKRSAAVTLNKAKETGVRAAKKADSVKKNFQEKSGLNARKEAVSAQKKMEEAAAVGDDKTYQAEHDRWSKAAEKYFDTPLGKVEFVGRAAGAATAAAAIVAVVGAAVLTMPIAMLGIAGLGLATAAASNKVNDIITNHRASNLSKIKTSGLKSVSADTLLDDAKRKQR